MSKENAIQYLTEAFDIWKKRSENDWSLDISLIDNYWWKES
jgi:hypothetical protein